MQQTTGTAAVASLSVPGADDGRALRLNLAARPSPGPRQGVTVASRYSSYRYGIFGSRLRSADCRGQDRPGVVTGTFVYAMDHSDANRNGLPDNDEIDIEFLCGQPDVIWMSLWTDYDEARDLPRKISRAVNLRTGTVLTTCYSTSWSGPCAALLPGENTPATVLAVPDYNSATRFRSYTFDWQPNRVTFQTVDDRGRKIVLWDYRGPVARIPQKPMTFMQNVWHTRNWDPLNGPSHNQPTADIAAYLDSTVLPR
jgi:beta-glucanase (GH16 family)